MDRTEERTAISNVILERELRARLVEATIAPEVVASHCPKVFNQGRHRNTLESHPSQPRRHHRIVVMTLRSDRSLDSSVLRPPAQFEIAVAAAAFGRYSEKAVPMQTHLRLASSASQP